MGVNEDVVFINGDHIGKFEQNQNETNKALTCCILIREYHN